MMAQPCSTSTVSARERAELSILSIVKCDKLRQPLHDFPSLTSFCLTYVRQLGLLDRPLSPIAYLDSRISSCLCCTAKHA